MLLAAALFVVAGCKKDDNKTDNGEKMTFTSYLGNGGAKTEIDGKDMKWTEGDEIVINGKTFISEISEDGTFATFTGDVVEPSFNAYYPASLYVENNYVLPATQIYAVNNLSGVNPMYACSENTTLVFHNICALVKLDLKGTWKVANIVAKADQPLSGAFSIEGNETNGYYAQLTSKDPAAVTLDCGDGVLLNETTPTTFYIALPKGNYTNLTFTVTEINGNTADVKQEGTAMLEAGRLWNKVARVSFTFTVDATGTKVEFAPGNLYWDGSAFHFEADQWSTTPASNGPWDESHVSHFFWSNTTDWQEPSTEPYASRYSYSTRTTSDVFFTNATDTTANENFQVSGETKGTWRTLSIGEWEYLLNTSGSSGRTEANRFAKAKVKGVCGLLIFPDGYKGATSGVGIATLNVTDAAYPDNSIPDDTWTSMETSGAVFLPAAGFRNNTGGVNAVGSSGLYWSSTPDKDSNSGAYRLYCRLGVSTEDGARTNGYAVRLVR